MEEKKVEPTEEVKEYKASPTPTRYYTHWECDGEQIIVYNEEEAVDSVDVQCVIDEYMLNLQRVEE